MRKYTFLLGLLVVLALQSKAQGYANGSTVADFKLKNVDGKMVSLADYKNMKGVVVVFTCNHCPYAQKYESRVMALAGKAKAMGYALVAINPNDPAEVPEDSYANMQARAKEKGYSFPYIFDETQQVARAFGATRTPHTYVLERKGNDFVVRYVGAIDDNYSDEGAVTARYIETAIQQLNAGQAVAVKETKAIGCTIKWRKS